MNRYKVDHRNGLNNLECIGVTKLKGLRDQNGRDLKKTITYWPEPLFTEGLTLPQAKKSRDFKNSTKEKGLGLQK